MPRRWDEIQKSVNSVVPESRITSNSGFFGQNIIILAFQITDYFLESIKWFILDMYIRQGMRLREFIVNIIAKPRSIYDG